MIYNANNESHWSPFLALKIAKSQNFQNVDEDTKVKKLKFIKSL